MYKIFIAFSFLLFCSPLVHAMKYSNMGIVDDGIANSIRPPRPPSVSQVIEDIRKNRGSERLEVLDFNSNNISTNGAIKIFNFVADETKQLQRLNLSHNAIYEEAAGVPAFKESLKRVLELPNLIEIDLQGNGIAELYVLQRISSEFGELSKKIKFGL